MIGAVCEDLAILKPLNAELNPIRHLLALAGGHHFVDVSRIRFNQISRYIIIRVRNIRPNIVEKIKNSKYKTTSFHFSVNFIFSIYLKPFFFLVFTIYF
jgi:hypothetical protein